MEDTVVHSHANAVWDTWATTTTTIEQIAAAVQISLSTLLNYFPSEEDVVLYDACDPTIASLPLNRPDERGREVGRQRRAGLAASHLQAGLRGLVEPSMHGMVERTKRAVRARFTRYAID